MAALRGFLGQKGQETTSYVLAGDIVFSQALVLLHDAVHEGFVG